MKQASFEAVHGAEWEAFEGLLQVLERPGRKVKEGIPERREMPERFRRLCHHLALARERHYSAALVDRLHALVHRGHQCLYGVRAGLHLRWLRYVAAEFPRAVRARWREVLVAALLFYAPLGALVWRIQVDPEAAYLVMEPQDLARMEGMYRSGNEKFGREGKADADMAMFGFYIWNNVRITFQCFASGAAAGIGSLFFLLMNGLYGGAVMGHLTRVGLGGNLWSFVITHSALEVNAIVLAGAAGLHLGLSWVLPGRRSRSQAFQEGARTGARLVYGAGGMCAVAALIEAFWSSSALVPHAVKFAVGGTLWALVLAYFLFAGRRRA